MVRLFKKDPEREAAENRYIDLLAQVAAGPVTGASVLPELRTAAQQAAISGRKDRKLTDRAVAALTEGVLADEVLTREEEDYVLETIEAIGIGDEDMQTRYQPLMKQLALGRANDGRLQVLDHDTHLMPQRGESVHLEMPAGLLKEVTLREFRGGSAGVSVRVAEGRSREQRTNARSDGHGRHRAPNRGRRVALHHVASGRFFGSPVV